MKSKNVEIEIPIFNDEYSVIVCWGDEKFVTKVGKVWHHKKKISLLKGKRGVCWCQEDRIPIIVIPKHPRTPQEIGTLAHEACHAMRDIYSSIEEEESCEDEIFAMCVGAIVRKTLASKK